MKKKSQKIIGDNIQRILRDIKSKVLNKYDLDDVHVHDISFSSTGGTCPPGQSWVCHYYGNDPVTGKPIIRCACVPNTPVANDQS